MQKRRFGKDQNSIWGELCLRQLGIQVQMLRKLIYKYKTQGTSGLKVQTQECA